MPDLGGLGGNIGCPGYFEVASLGEDGPGDAGDLIGERDQQNVVMQTLLRRRDPVLETIAFPALRFDKVNPGRLHEQRAEIAVAAFGDLALCRARHRAGYADRRTMPSRSVFPSIYSDLHVVDSA